MASMDLVRFIFRNVRMIFLPLTCASIFTIVHPEYPLQNMTHSHINAKASLELCLTSTENTDYLLRLTEIYNYPKIDHCKCNIFA